MKPFNMTLGKKALSESLLDLSQAKTMLLHWVGSEVGPFFRELGNAGVSWFCAESHNGLGCRVLTLPSDPATIADLRFT